MAEVQGPYYYGMGRRKTAVARVRLYPNGEGQLTVNGRDGAQYFPRETLIQDINSPLRMVDLMNRFTITVKVVGGGVSGQAGAVRHAIARALIRANEEYRSTLRRGGFLTRDPRMKERKKYGLKRARQAPQYTKR